MAEPRVVIGLETHVQLNTLKSKMFCGCSTEYHDAEPNTHVCPVCLGLPGSLPVLNEGAVEAAIKVSLALGCTIEGWTQFYRKNYYYPDLPKGFQISQYDYPIGKHGCVEIEGDNGPKKVRITRVHMGSIEHSRYALVDYNRSGMPLLEIVSEPDLSSPKEARRYLDKSPYSPLPPPPHTSQHPEVLALIPLRRGRKLARLSRIASLTATQCTLHAHMDDGNY